MGQWHEFQAQHQKETGPEDHHQHRWPPDEAIELIDQGIEKFHVTLLILVYGRRFGLLELKTML
ncbi:hypothetical protein D9M68_783260 [compost metagenome]